MTLTTDELRRALTDAADAPYDAAGVARLQGVRAKVRRARQRRAAAISGVGALAVAAVVGTVTLGGTRTATPPPASSTASGVPSTRPAPPPELPANWGPRAVVGGLTGAGTDTPTRLVTWPSDVTGVLFLCSRENSGVQLRLEPVGGAAITWTMGCTTSSEPFLVQELSSDDAHFRPGQQVRLQVSRAWGDDPTTTSFGAGLLVGRDVIDLSKLRVAPHGWTSVGAYALTNGFQYSAFSPDGKAHGTPVTDGVQIALADQRTARLRVQCLGDLRLTVDPGAGSEPTSVTCPSGSRTTQTVDVDLQPGKQQRLTLRAVDAAPGALVEVGVSTR